ncbi:Protein detoxification 48 [Vitis vinifera]|uniref:Protein detoxification 48 n=1 Tax=Vitis vinifera TaxID=29760 RepID=A0A438F886_VITVI|nr:Protein detoxification 48 [Vitis vinifera]
MDLHTDDEEEQQLHRWPTPSEVSLSLRVGHSPSASQTSPATLSSLGWPWNGTHFVTSLWRKAMEASWLNFAKDSASPPLHLHPHLLHVAQHEENPLLVRTDEEISSMAHTFIIFSIPDLFFLSILHPLRIYLRTQSITLPLTYCSAISVLLHVPLNFLLVVHFKLGIAGVAIAMVWTNLNLFLLLISFIFFSGVYKGSWVAPSIDCLRGWSSLLALAVPTCISVCLEWWCLCLPSALSLGVSTRVGNELGATGQPKPHLHDCFSLLRSGFGPCSHVFTTLMRHQWGRFFTNDAEVLELTAVALPIAGLCELGNCPQTTGCGVLRGSARPTEGANINLGSFYLVGMPVAIIMGFVAKNGVCRPLAGLACSTDLLCLSYALRALSNRLGGSS